MPQPVLVEPDLNFIKAVKAKGGETLKKCFQCASCSVTCNLSPDAGPFPRKEMIWAQWGLKERLIQDPDIWLCHQCNDCSKYCPRGAKPGDVLAALRQLAIVSYAFPRFMGRIVSDPRYLPLLLAIPILILAVITNAMGTFRIHEGEVIYRKFIDYRVIDTVFTLTAFWAVLCSFIGIQRMWRAFRSGEVEKKNTPISGWQFATLTVIPTILEILKHGHFKECSVNRARYWAHFNTLWGFILLGITTTAVVAGVYLFGKFTPWPLSHPIKWIGNLGAVALILGTILILRNRLSHAEDRGKTTYFDWLLWSVIFAIGISGLLSEILRLADVPSLAYPIYFIHLVFVWVLFATLPFSKLAHILYRTTALVYARHTGRPLQRSKVPLPIKTSSPG